jgi:SNF2 family DNA or RNA helicase
MSVFDFENVEHPESNVPAQPDFTPVPISNEVEPEDNDSTGNLDEDDAEVIRLRDELAVISVDITHMTEDMQEGNDKIAALNTQIAELRKRMQEELEVLATNRREVETELFDERRALRARESEADLKRRELAQAEAKAAAKKRLLKNASMFDELTINAPWREWALDHQIKGAKILANSGRALLADKMGLGKTLTSLITADMLQVQKVLVVVPDDVIGNFNREIKHWAPHRTLMTLGKLTKAERDVSLFVMGQLPEYICTINYSAWRKDSALLDRIAELKFEMVIADEAHTMKTTTTSAYRGVRKIVLAENSCPTCRENIEQVKTSDRWRNYWRCTVCEWRSDEDVSNEAYSWCSVKYVLPMTGTPILNKPQDLFAILSLIDPVNFSELQQYLKIYCEQDWASGKWRFKSGGLERLTRQLADKYLARDRKSAGVILPPQSVQIHEVEIDAELYPGQHRVIEQLSKHAEILLTSGKKMSAIAAIALITRKRQANVYPAGIEMRDENGDVVFRVGDEVTESAKLDYIIDANGEGLAGDLTEGGMDQGERIAIFSQFKGPLAELERRFNAAGISVVRYDGDTPDYIRQQVQMDFDRKYCEADGYTKRWQVVLCNYKTGGVGINFTGVTQSIILDEEWNPGKRDQAYGRTDRMGQTEETTVHVIRSPRTIDTWMARLIEEKENLIDGFESNIDLAQELFKAIQEGEF